MMQKPYINAFLAECYIVFLVFLLQMAPKGPDDPIITPIIVLSVFVLSAAIMGYLFVMHPLLLYIEGKKKQAVTFFMHTILYFASFAALILVAWVAASSFA